MSLQLSSRCKLHLKWLGATLFIAAACCAIYGLDRRGGPAGGGTVVGYVLGALGLGLMLLAGGYTLRRRLRPGSFGETIARQDPEREQRLARLNEAIADLQVAAAGQRETASHLRKAAEAAVKGAGFAGEIGVDVLAGEAASPLLRLIPREHPGRLENWLMAHQYLGAVVVLVVGLHAGFQWRGAVAKVAVLLTVLTVASGFVGSIGYLLGPRWLMRGERSPLDTSREAVLRKLTQGWLCVHVALTGALLGAVLVHVLSVLYY